MSSSMYVYSLADGSLDSITKEKDGTVIFHLTLWNNKPATITAKGVDYFENIEGSDAYDLNDLLYAPELDTKTAKGYALEGTSGDIVIKFRAASVEKT